MKCSITIYWDQMSAEEKEQLLCFLHSEDFQNTPPYLRWLSAITPEEKRFDAPEDSGRFSGYEYNNFLEVLRFFAKSYPSLKAKIRGSAGRGIWKFDLGGIFDIDIKNGELCESFTGIP